jgi:hypothetical protein
MQIFAPLPVVFSAKGTLKATGYAGYVIVTVTTSSTSAFINYTVDGPEPRCTLDSTRLPTSFSLYATSEVTMLSVQK